MVGSESLVSANHRDWQAVEVTHGLWGELFSHWASPPCAGEWWAFSIFPSPSLSANTISNLASPRTWYLALFCFYWDNSRGTINCPSLHVQDSSCQVHRTQPWILESHFQNISPTTLPYARVHCLCTFLQVKHFPLCLYPSSLQMPKRKGAMETPHWLTACSFLHSMWGFLGGPPELAYQVIIKTLESERHGFKSWLWHLKFNIPSW